MERVMKEKAKAVGIDLCVCLSDLARKVDEALTSLFPPFLLLRLIWMGWSRSYGGTVSQPTDALRLLALAWDQGGETQQLALVNRLFKVRFFHDFIRHVRVSKECALGLISHLCAVAGIL